MQAVLPADVKIISTPLSVLHQQLVAAAFTTIPAADVHSKGWWIALRIKQCCPIKLPDVHKNVLLKGEASTAATCLLGAYCGSYRADAAPVYISHCWCG